MNPLTPSSGSDDGVAASPRWWHDPHSGQFVTAFCCLCIAFPAAVGLIAAWLSGQL